MISTPRVFAVTLLLAASAHASPGAVLTTAGRTDAGSGVLLAGVDSTAWATLQAGYLHRTALQLGGAPVHAGVLAEVPVLRWLRGGPDAGRVGGLLVARPWAWRQLGVTLELASRVGYLEDAMGTTVTWDVVGRAALGARFEHGDVGLVAGVQQGLGSWLRRSSWARSGFADRYEGARGGDTDGVVALPSTRVHLGLAGGVELSPRLSLVGSAGVVIDPARYSAGPFDRMMIGTWPFAAELAIVWRL